MSKRIRAALVVAGLALGTFGLAGMTGLTAAESTGGSCPQTVCSGTQWCVFSADCECSMGPGSCTSSPC